MRGATSDFVTNHALTRKIENLLIGSHNRNIFISKSDLNIYKYAICTYSL